MTLAHVNDGTGLLIGEDPTTGRVVYYHGERGLLTVAAPGSGKTQNLMMPNLLEWAGPAVVLDITGELWDRTSRQRRKFGPVYRVDPDHPEISDCYNPFDYIRFQPGDYRHVWQDAQTLAKLVFTKQSGESGAGGFYDLASLDYIAVLACFIAVKEQPWKRNMETLNRYISEAPLEGIMAAAEEIDELPGLQNAANALKNSDERTKGNVVWSAKNCVGAWDDPAVVKVSRVSDWHPRMIRPNNATVYICLSLERIEKYPAFVRLIVGQHLRELMRYPVDRKKTRIIQFFLDETPQLQKMNVLVQAIEGGRNYKIRVWMVMQFKAQFEQAYGKDFAKGLMALCGLRSYMNPSMQDGLAQELSEQIGTHFHRMDQTQRPIHTPQDLARDAFKNDVITFDNDVFTRLRKYDYNRDAALKKLEGASA